MDTTNSLPVVVYSRPSCVQCNATYRWLESHQIRYRVVNVEEDPIALQKIKQLGYLQAPVVVVPFDWPNGGSHWSGFNPGELAKLIG